MFLALVGLTLGKGRSVRKKGREQVMILINFADVFWIHFDCQNGQNALVSRTLVKGTSVEKYTRKHRCEQKY